MLKSCLGMSAGSDPVLAARPGEKGRLEGLIGSSLRRKDRTD